MSPVSARVVVSLVYPPTSTDTLLRAIGKRAHALHVLSFFASQCILISTIAYVPRVAGFDSDGPLGTPSSMIVFKVHPVVPTRALWLFMMFLIGLFGLIAQVCSSTPSSSAI